MKNDDVIILLIEDDQEEIDQLEEAFEDLGYTVISKKKGEDALVIFKQLQPTLVIMDIDLLPGKIDGIETAKRMNAIREVPIFYNTRYPERCKEAMKTNPTSWNIKRDDYNTIIQNVELTLKSSKSNSWVLPIKDNGSPILHFKTKKNLIHFKANEIVAVITDSMNNDWCYVHLFSNGVKEVFNAERSIIDVIKQVNLSSLKKISRSIALNLSRPYYLGIRKNGTTWYALMSPDFLNYPNKIVDGAFKITPIFKEDIKDLITIL